MSGVAKSPELPRIPFLGRGRSIVKTITAKPPEVNAWLSEKDPDNDGVMRAYFVLQAAYDEAHR